MPPKKSCERSKKYSRFIKSTPPIAPLFYPKKATPTPVTWDGCVTFFTELGRGNGRAGCDGLAGKHVDRQGIHVDAGLVVELLPSLWSKVAVDILEAVVLLKPLDRLGNFAVRSVVTIEHNVAKLTVASRHHEK